MRRLVVGVVLLLAWHLRANDMIVDTRTMKLSDLASVTITLEGDFAEIDEPHVPLRNLQFVGEPSVSSEFAWINGRVSRRKSFRYRVRALAPGSALVGPVVLNSPDGRVETLAAVGLRVEAERVIGSNEAEVVLRSLLAERRDPLFVVAEAEPKAAFVGEPIVVTWYLYNGAAVQQWQVLSVPKLAQFWVEELGRGERAERVYVGDVMMQRLPIRRAMLFPLQSGTVSVEGMSIEAAVMQQTRGGPFSMFEGMMVEVTYTSAPFELDIKPLPPGPRVDAIGTLNLRCERPVQRNAGPVVVRVALDGLGNLRAANAPRFDRKVDGTVQIEGGEVTVAKDEGALSMSRRWQYLVFPSSPGPLEIPPLSMQIFDPKTAEYRRLQCVSTFVDVVAAQPPATSSTPPPEAPSTTPMWPWALGTLALLIVGVIAVPRLRRELMLRREVKSIVSDATPEEILARMQARVRIDPRELTDRGDAWRALQSLLEAATRGRDVAADADDEIRRRVRDVLRAAGS